VAARGPDFDIGAALGGDPLEPVNLRRIEFWLKVSVGFFFWSLVLVFLVSRVADWDLWGYLSFGRLFWHSSTFPYRDVFAYVPTLNLWVYHEWLTGVLFYPLYQTLGAAGLQTLKYVLGLSTMGLIYLVARDRGAHPLVSALFAAISLITVRQWYNPVRAQVFTFFFFSLFLYLLERARISNRWWSLYLLPVILIPWCNLHGGFLAGLGLIAIYLIGEFLARRPFLPYLAAFCLSILATLVNPYGVEYWVYLAHAVTMSRPHITEWLSLFQAYRAGMTNIAPFISLFGLIFIALFAMWQYRWRDLTASLALAATLILGVKHIRHLPFFLILAGAYLPVCLNVNVDYLKSRPILKRLWGSAGIKTGITVSLALLTVMNFYSFSMKNPFTLEIPAKSKSLLMPLEHYPVDAVNFIKKQGLSGRILTLFIWGEYLIWELYPQCLIAYDGRYETVYPPEINKYYADFQSGGSKWRQFLKKYPPNLILLNKGMKVVKLIHQDPQWREIYADKNCVLFMAGKNNRINSRMKKVQPWLGALGN
jgi:hypothetical protein